MRMTASHVGPKLLRNSQVCLARYDIFIKVCRRVVYRHTVGIVNVQLT